MMKILSFLWGFKNNVGTIIFGLTGTLLTLSEREQLLASVDPLFVLSSI